MAAYISFIAYKISTDRYVLFLKEVYQFVILYRDIFSKCPLIWGSISKWGTFFGIFLVLPIDYSRYEKTILGIFVYLFNFRFYKQCSQAAARAICERAISAQNAGIFF